MFDSGEATEYAMELVLIPGWIFWSSMAFFGTRTMFLEGRGPMAEPLAHIKRDFPLVLPVTGAIGLGAGLIFALREILAVREGAGLIGASWIAGFACGIAGAVALSAQMFLSEDA